MLVTISLEHPHTHYTNLDVIRGRVSLRVPAPSNVASIIVKLEGEARTRLLAAIRPDRPDRQKPVLEVHKASGQRDWHKVSPNSVLDPLQDTGSMACKPTSRRGPCELQSDLYPERWAI
jgi:hypothetical protein